MFGRHRVGAGLAVLLATSGWAADPAPPVPAPLPSGQIRGSVSYGRRDPAAGAVVVVRKENASSPVHAATTGAFGAFAFDGLADGTYRADVARDGYKPVVKSGIVV